MTAAAARQLPSQPLRRLARAGVLSLGASVGIQGLNVVSGVILARVLGPAGRGELAAVLLWPGLLAALGGLSTAEGMTYLTARGADSMRDTVASALAISLVQALALAAVGYVALPLVLGHYGALAVSAGRLYLVSLPSYFMGQAGMAILQGRLRWVALNLVRVAVTVATVGGLVLLLVAHRVTVVNATWVYVLANLLGLLLALGVIAAHGWLGVSPDLGLIRSAMAFGLKTHVGKLAGQANLNLDKTAVAMFLTRSDLGLYSAAVTLSAPLTLIGSAIGTIALPSVASSEAATEMREQFAWLFRSALVLAAATTVALVLLTPTLVRTFFGVAFLPAVVIAQISITAGLSRGVCYVLAYGLTAFNRPLVPSVGEGAAVLVTVVGLAVLLPTLGLVGAAITSLLAYTTSAAYMVGFAKRRLGIPLRELLLPRPADIGPWARCLRG